MQHLRNSSIRRFSVLCYQSKLFSTQTLAQVDEWQNAKPYTDIPGPSSFKLLKESAIPGGKYYQLPFPDMISRFREEYGTLVKLPGAFGKRDIVVVYLPDDVEKVFRADGKRPIRRGLESVAYYRSHFRPDIYKEAPGLATTLGEQWYNFRTKVNAPLMEPKTVKLYVPRIDEVAVDFVKRIRKIRDSKDEVPGDFYYTLNDFTLESIAVIALDKRLGIIEDPSSSILNKKVKDMFVSVYEYDFLPSVWRYYQTSGFKKALKNYDEITDIVSSFVSAALEERKKSGYQSSGDNEGVLDKLLKIDKNVAIVMAQDMLISGIDTTAITAALMFYFLAKNPEKQEILRQEILKLLPEKDSVLTATSLSNIPYLRACLKETMRLHPAAPFNGRGLSQDLIIQGYQVPKDTDILVSSSSKDETYFKRSKEFIPERWLKDNVDPGCPHATDSHPFASLPFGHGPRMCVGFRLAEVELEVLMARILREFKIEWHHPQLNFKFAILNVPANPLKFKFTDLKH